MNVFRDIAEVGEIVELDAAIAGHWPSGEAAVAIYRGSYGADYYNDDVNRCGPAIPLAKELFRRMEHLAGSA